MPAFGRGPSDIFLHKCSTGMYVFCQLCEEYLGSAVALLDFKFPSLNGDLNFADYIIVLYLTFEVICSDRNAYILSEIGIVRTKCFVYSLVTWFLAVGYHVTKGRDLQTITCSQIGSVPFRMLKFFQIIMNFSF
jgi:hypothetical protein